MEHPDQRAIANWQGKVLQNNDWEKLLGSMETEYDVINDFCPYVNAGLKMISFLDASAVELLQAF